MLIKSCTHNAYQQMKEPLVIIHCLVYNHEPYLRQCLDGFVMQQTAFPFYAVVHDDASTDKSADIIREYEAKYPEIIRPIYETENQYSKKDGTLSRIMYEACKSATYIAMCEGDDYWTDPHKLQKQVDFLEAHSDYSFIGSKCKLQKGEIFEDEDYALGINPISHEGNVKLYGDVFSSLAIYGPPTRTNTLVYRAECIKDEININWDYYLQAVLASKGKFARINTAMSVFRIHLDSISNNRTPAGRLHYAQWYVNLRLALLERFPNDCPFTKEESVDIVTYEQLKNAISNKAYKEAMRAKANLNSFFYKNKTYARYLKGPCTFFLLYLFTKIKKQ